MPKAIMSWCRFEQFTVNLVCITFTCCENIILVYCALTELENIYLFNHIIHALSTDAGLTN
jgi:hypothetical protein